MDFSKAKGLTITEGVVRQITDASGIVLWSATVEPATAVVKLLADTFLETYYASAEIDYRTPDAEVGSLTTAGEYELPIGTIITCSVKWNGKERANLIIYLNGEVVRSSESSVLYEYTLTKNIDIEPRNNYYNGGDIYITEET